MKVRPARDEALSTKEVEARYRGMHEEHALEVQLGAALACSLAAFMVRFALDPFLGLHQPFTPAFAAVAFAAWYGSWRAGLLCAVVSHLWADYFFIEPRYSFELTSHRGLSALLYYFLVAVLLYTSYRARKARWTSKVLVARLQAADKQKSDLLAILAHELRNPLSAASAALELLKVRADMPGVRDQAEAVLGRQLEHMTRLASELTDAARINEGKIDLQLRRVSVADVMHFALSSVQPSLASRHQNTELELAEGLPDLEADSMRLNQVLTNLLYNASKFSPDGAVIKVVVAKQNDGVSIKVVDPGIGIPPEQLAGVFDSYVQLRRNGQGLGLGLSLVRQLVHLHGGTVRALSRGVDEGATFEVFLPSAKATTLKSI